MSIVSAAVDLVRVHPHVAYAAAFLLAMLESVPVIGAVMPGTAVIVALSTLVPGGTLLFWPLLFSVTLGAIVGDGLSFWAGHRYHERVLSRWPMNRHPEFVGRSEEFFRRHGGKSILFARFIPGVRAFVPLIAGILRMPVRRFYVTNIISALVWAPSHILSGMLVGAAIGFVGTAAERLAILLIMAILAFWSLAWVLRFGMRRVAPVLVGARQRVWMWSASSESWTACRLRPLLDPSSSEGAALAVMAGGLVGAAWLFFGILEDVASGDPLVRADVSIYHLLQSLRTPLGDSLMTVVTELGDAVVALPVAAAVAVMLAVQRHWRTVLYWVGAVGGALALETAIKGALHRARPGMLFYTGWSRFSFPSGHSTLNAVMYAFLAFLVVRNIRPAGRMAVALASACLVALIAFSRLYLGAHWFSDVAGGLAFGMAWVAVLGIAYFHHQPPHRVRGVLTAACLALFVAGSINVSRKHTLDMQRYAMRETMPTVLAAGSWSAEWHRVPARRVDLGGDEEEPLTVQWAGSLAALTSMLETKGWQRPGHWSMTGVLAWLTTSASPMGMPAFPYLDNGRLPSLTLIHPLDEGPSSPGRLVLRLWATGFELKNGGATPIWAGNVVAERFTHPLSLFTLPRVQDDLDRPRDILADALPGRQIVGPAPQAPGYAWDRQILLIH